MRHALKTIDITEIGTGRNRLGTCTEAGANAANRVRTELGVNYGNMTKTNGYIDVPLDGIWLRAPLPPQRLSAEPPRPARAGRAADEGLLPRL